MANDVDSKLIFEYLKSLISGVETKVDKIENQVRSIRSTQAQMKKEQIELKDELKEFEKEQRKVRREREEREKKQSVIDAKIDELIDTTPDIQTLSDEEKLSLSQKLIMLKEKSKRQEMWIPVIRDAIRLLLAVAGIIGALYGLGFEITP